MRTPAHLQAGRTDEGRPPGELRGLLEACARAPQEVRHRQDSVTRRRRDAAFLSLLYASGLRPG